MTKFKSGGMFVLSRGGGKRVRTLADEITGDAAEELRVFKDDRDAYVAQVSLCGEHFILKKPRRRDNRPWERFLTLFRDGSALRCFKSMEKLRELGFNAPEPVLAGEKRGMGLLKDSFLLYRFVDAQPAEKRHAEQIAGELIRLHGMGYLRRDAYLKNFLVSDSKVYFIDSRLKRPLLFRKIHCYRELSIFLRTVPDGLSILPENVRGSASFRIAMRLDKFVKLATRTRRKIRKGVNAILGRVAA